MATESERLFWEMELQQMLLQNVDAQVKTTVEVVFPSDEPMWRTGGTELVCPLKNLHQEMLFPYFQMSSSPRIFYAVARKGD